MSLWNNFIVYPSRPGSILVDCIEKAFPNSSTTDTACCLILYEVHHPFLPSARICRRVLLSLLEKLSVRRASHFGCKAITQILLDLHLLTNIYANFVRILFTALVTHLSYEPSLRQLTLDYLMASSSKTNDAIDLKFSEYLGVAMYT